MQIKVCGFATMADHDHLLQLATTTSDGKAARDKANITIPDDRLLALATQRANRIESFLSEEHQVKTKRLIDCKSKIEKDEKAQPRVELSL